ncbi:4-alpha-glucanotransferase [Kocuria palustris]|uniref:4-alpha-glucanotransferase n=1 Tax=Kocuria palustris TaxID=71999 RepID=UPI0011A95754|nr:4-alpha-glucanotransferase [Kocuria palustris]
MDHRHDGSPLPSSATGSPGEGATGATLRRLAEQLGVSTRYEGFDGQEAEVPEATLSSVLSALDMDVSSEDAAQRSLRSHLDAPWGRMLPPVVIAVEGRGDAFRVHVPSGASPVVEVVVDGEPRTLEPEAGGAETREIDGRRIDRLSYRVPADLAPEWYELRASAPEVDHGVPTEIELAVTPERLSTTDRLLDKRRWGWAVQLYSVASDRTWGVGDVNDLGGLAAIGGEQGADYVLVNPLHASEPVPPIEPSPYLPVTRRFFNPLYLRIADIPEMVYLRPGDAEIVSTLDVIQRRRILDVDDVERDEVHSAKLKALELLYTVRRSAQRQQQLRRFVAESGQQLQDFALWCAIREEIGPDSPLWEDEAAGPEAPYAVEARTRLEGRIHFHIWLQWLLDEQLAGAQHAAKAAGMSIGVMHDLAVGVSKDGADAWSLNRSLARGVSVGAPADMYNQQGQDWSQPPWHPFRLAESGYRPWREMLRSIFRHAGGIRVDHIMGLFRLWWIPEGNAASDGAYVSYDHEAMLGILALEAQRADVVVVGEDLGTVEPWVRDELSARGVLGTSVLWFETEGEGPKDPRDYRVETMASVGTHDFPPTAGYLQGVQVDLRDELDLLERPVEQERAEAQASVRRWLDAVAEEGLLPEDADEQHTVEALHAYLGLAPSLLHCVQLVDAVGERRVQNQPGTSGEQHPNWRIPLADGDGRRVLLEDLQSSERARSLSQVMNRALGRAMRRTERDGAPSQPRRADPEAPTAAGDADAGPADAG